jgi:Flp pilus assembly protein CpaB
MVIVMVTLIIAILAAFFFCRIRKRSTSHERELHSPVELARLGQQPVVAVAEPIPPTLTVQAVSVAAETLPVAHVSPAYAK